MPYRSLPVTPFEQNCSLLWCERTRQAAVIDPGGDIDKILALAKQLDIHISQVLLTHGHLDHVGGAADLAKQLQAPIVGPHRGDQFWLDALPQQAAMFRFGSAQPLQPNRWLNDGDTVSVGDLTLQVKHCPGHTPGHVVFYVPEEGIAFVGDVLFAGSIGRTDFPQGDYEQLVNSIRQQLWPLGDDVEFIPGHGPNSTFGEERRHNPFVADKRYG